MHPQYYLVWPLAHKRSLMVKKIPPFLERHTRPCVRGLSHISHLERGDSGTSEAIKLHHTRRRRDLKLYNTHLTLLSIIVYMDYPIHISPLWVTIFWY